ncbi:hypothetical protein PCANC_27556 [Puccinia coronata f. sp. avenae]|uniref:Kinetochore protein Nuf2 N-terminal domain-containing protein n=1 Tax=Puccinia coronata f. sp. avenae TaxID=200324 RepID=A0A2N5TQZ8_9BASI|nr:hypothetical protein PCANC_27556 [Puccinia coronata f. sp. avenae]
MSFPNFPFKEIAKAITSFGYPGDLTPADIAKPTAGKMMLIHKWFLLYFSSITQEDLCNTVMDQLNHIHHPKAQRRTKLLKEQLERAHAGIHRKRQGAKERYKKAVERHKAVLEAQVEHTKGMEQQLKLKAHLAAQIENSVEDYVCGLKKGQAVYENIHTEVFNFATKHQAALNAMEAKLNLSPENLLVDMSSPLSLASYDLSQYLS